MGEEAKKRGKEIMFQKPESGGIGPKRGKKRKSEPMDDEQQGMERPTKRSKFNHMDQFDDDREDDDDFNKNHNRFADDEENDILNESGAQKKKLKKKKKKKKKEKG